MESAGVANFRGVVGAGLFDVGLVAGRFFPGEPVEVGEVLTGAGGGAGECVDAPLEETESLLASARRLVDSVNVFKLPQAA